MRLVLGIFVVLFCFSEANGQSFPGTMPADTIVCNNTSVETFPINCLWYVLPQSNKWFTNTAPPANISKVGDRLFIGDAVNYTALSSLACGTDWFSNFQGTLSPNGCGAYLPYSQFAVSSGGDGQHPNSGMAILATSQTKNAANPGAADIALSAFGVANDSIGALAWGVYDECNYTNASSAGCNSLESEITTFVNNTGDVDSYIFDAKTVNLNLACGSGLTSPATFTCGSAISIGSNPAKFANGIRFGGDPVAIGSAGVINAINMPPAYSIVWNNSPSSIAGRVYVGGGGNLNLDTVGTLVSNGNAGVSCAAGTINALTVKVVNGLVTHC